jgi:hypothetical protein
MSEGDAGRLLLFTSTEEEYLGIVEQPFSDFDQLISLGRHMHDGIERFHRELNKETKGLTNFYRKLRMVSKTSLARYRSAWGHISSRRFGIENFRCPHMSCDMKALKWEKPIEHE